MPFFSSHPLSLSSNYRALLPVAHVAEAAKCSKIVNAGGCILGWAICHCCRCLVSDSQGTGYHLGYQQFVKTQCTRYDHLGMSSNLGSLKKATTFRFSKFSAGEPEVPKVETYPLILKTWSVWHHDFKFFTFHIEIAQSFCQNARNVQIAALR